MGSFCSPGVWWFAKFPSCCACWACSKVWKHRTAGFLHTHVACSPLCATCYSLAPAV